MAKKMTIKKFEDSAADRRMDKKKGYKEGSKRDNTADRAAVNRINKKAKK